VLSFGGFAAKRISAQQAQNGEAIGSPSVSAIGSSPMDMNAMLSKKADEQGATAYDITRARSGSNWHATAELYK
ncbi:YdgH/BhsA/McbA-like domain containing protein, partial [Salmonella enterica]|uniref:YdgH/BhsA/McbA-like domain containing protein n=1 Tax=Salmonella enterica TaxID=28901 RepID=UPI00329875D2